MSTLLMICFIGFILHLLGGMADDLCRKLEQLWLDWRFRKDHNMTKAELQAFDAKHFPKY